MTVQENFYREQARLCGNAAEGADLENQRDKFLRAERAWLLLADRTGKIQSDRENRLADALAQARADG